MNGDNGMVRQAGGERASRRVVLLSGPEESEVAEVLAEYAGAEANDTRLHQELQRRAQEHCGRYVAVEWRGPRGWVRFLWCRK